VPVIFSVFWQFWVNVKKQVSIVEVSGSLPQQGGQLGLLVYRSMYKRLAIIAFTARLVLVQLIDGLSERM